MSSAADRIPIETELARFEATLEVPAEFPLRSRILLAAIHEQVFDAQLNVGLLRKRCRLTDHNVSSEFRHAVGMTIPEYIESIRLLAVERLRRHGISVAGAARAVGFAHVQTYYRARSRRAERDRVASRSSGSVGESIAEGMPMRSASGAS